MKKLGLSDRIGIVEGDFFKNDLPEGYDLHLLSHVLHDWDEADVKMLLKKSYRSLKPGGMIIIHDAHINRRKTGPVSVAEYSVLLMFSTAGKCYSVQEIFAGLNEAGFSDLKFVPGALNRSLITGRKK